MSEVEYKVGDKINLCKCGCGKWVIYHYKNKWSGIPKYLPGHNLR